MDTIGETGSSASACAYTRLYTYIILYYTGCVKKTDGFLNEVTF
jgi:hypothetical protein